MLLLLVSIVGLPISRLADFFDLITVDVTCDHVHLCRVFRFIESLDLFYLRAASFIWDFDIDG